MQKCSICEKPIYGHPLAKSGQKLVCGSCPLNKMQGGPSGKSLFHVRLDMAKMVTKQIPGKQESIMSDLKVKSNVKNRTILLDGRFPLVFDAEGFGKMPAHLLPALELEMKMKPNRFSIVDEPPPVAVEVPVVAVPAEPVVVEAAAAVEKAEEVSAPAEELSPNVDQSFLTEEPVKPSKKASKK